MTEDDARRLLRSAYPMPEGEAMAWRSWIEHPAALRRPRRALMAAVIAAAVAVVIALPVGITLALHQSPRVSNPPVEASPGATCPLANGVTSAEFDRDSASKQYFVFPSSVSITSPARVDDLTAALCALQRQAPGVYHCPPGSSPTFALSYTARLLDGNHVVQSATIFANTCPLVYGLGGSGTRLVREAQTWALIGLALGIPDATLQTFTGSSAPPSTAAPSPTPAPVLVPESLSWTGARRGTLTQAYGTCNQPNTNMIYLFSAGDSVEFALPPHAPGVVSIGSPSMVDGGVSFHLDPAGPGSFTLFLGASGTVTYSPNGTSGSINAWLAPENEVSPLIHITGTWRCA